MPPILTPPTFEEFETETEADQVTAGKAPELKYGDQTPVNCANADELKTFEAYQLQKKSNPPSRDVLHAWVRGGPK